MTESIIVALITGAVSLLGSYWTMRVSVQRNKQSNDLTLYRIEKLEEKVGKHNNLMERTYKLESDVRNANTHISDLERNVSELKH